MRLRDDRYNAVQKLQNDTFLVSPWRESQTIEDWRNIAKAVNIKYGESLAKNKRKKMFSWRFQTL